MMHAKKGFHSYVVRDGLKLLVLVPAKSLINNDGVILFVGRMEGVQRCFGAGIDTEIVRLGEELV